MSKNTPLKAIKKKCLECSGGDKEEVRNCALRQCPLFPFRMGVDPQTSMELPLNKEEAGKEEKHPDTGKRKSEEQFSLF